MATYEFEATETTVSAIYKGERLSDSTVVTEIGILDLTADEIEGFMQQLGVQRACEWINSFKGPDAIHLQRHLASQNRQDLLLKAATKVQPAITDEMIKAASEPKCERRSGNRENGSALDRKPADNPHNKFLATNSVSK